MCALYASDALLSIFILHNPHAAQKKHPVKSFLFSLKIFPMTNLKRLAVILLHFLLLAIIYGRAYMDGYDHGLYIGKKSHDPSATFQKNSLEK